MELKPGYKRTEVGVIPEDWVTCELQEVATADWGNTSITKSHYRPDGFQAFSASGPDGFVSWYEHDAVAVVISAIGAQCGKTWLATGRWTPIKNTIWFRADQSKASTEYLFRATANPEIWPKSGQAQPFVSVTGVRTLKVPLPSSINEQLAIATALSDVDALITKLDQLIAKKRDIKQAAMQQLLTGKTRLPGFSGEWEVKRLGDIASIRNQKILPSQVDADTPCVDLEHIGQGDGRLLASSTAEHSTSTKYRFFVGDVLFGRLRAYLRKYWLADRDGICTTEIWPLMSEVSRADSRFLLALVQSDSFIEAASIAYGTHMPRADWAVMRNFELRLPGVLEQTAIATVLSDMDAQIATLEARRDKIQALKQGMMQVLLTGQVRLPVNNEPMEALA